MILEGSLVRLRPMRPEDAADGLRWLRDPEVNPEAARWSISVEDEAAWIENRLDAPEGYFEMETLEGNHIGSASMHSIDPQDAKATLAIHIGDTSAWGKGYGTDATKLLLRYAFETRGLHRVELSVRASNARAIRLYETLGFRHEGTKRDAFRFQGIYEDEQIMGMLATEWKRLPGGQERIAAAL